MPRETPIYAVDAFASVPFRGNPAAVCLLTAERDPAWMQALAAEMSLSETAFVHLVPESSEAPETLETAETVETVETAGTAGAPETRGRNESTGNTTPKRSEAAARSGALGSAADELRTAATPEPPVRGGLAARGPSPLAAAPLRLRWFTPAVEVRLCGHATLASAHVLWESGHLPPAEPARFASHSGVLTATRRDDGSIELDFPARSSTRAEPPEGLIEALGAQPSAVSLTAEGDVLVELFDAATVRALEPDLAMLERIEARGVIVTARADDGEHDVVSRFFAPAVGVPEDPVTGSAHCALGPYWAKRLGKERLRAHQASRRGGVVEVTMRGERVGLAGRAVTVWEGRLRV